MAWALRGGAGGAALLSFKIGPVQAFIEAARSLRDLLTGSYLLSTLVFAAIEPLLEACGPTALIYPALRGVPVMDHWLWRQGVGVARPQSEELVRPSIPHRFLALVPHSLASNLMTAAREAALTRWREIAAAVRARLKSKLDADWPGWDRLWEAQIEPYFDARATAFRISEADQEALLGSDALRRFEPIAQLGWCGNVKPGSWQNSIEISARLMEACSQIRHIPSYTPVGDVPQKCALLGTYEQMGPARLRDSNRFFEEGLKFEKGTDRLCAISLTKRFAFNYYFQDHLGIDLTPFPDMIDLCQRSGKGFRYYSLILMDGDEMGGWLSGEKSPQIRKVLHPKIVAWHERSNGNPPALELRRPVSPALHAAISEALNRFATETAPRIVKEHNGVVIYCGGDDLLAALPLITALECAHKLRLAFSSFDILGDRATASAGLVIAHEMEDLRYVLRWARDSEKRSKRARKDRVTLAVLRRSGEHSAASCRWDYLPTLGAQCASFRRGSSDRWTYLLRRQLPVLQGLPAEALRGELKRLLARSEKRDPRFAKDLDEYLKLEGQPPEQGVLADFLALCQSASFMARGRD